PYTTLFRTLLALSDAGETLLNELKLLIELSGTFFQSFQRCLMLHLHLYRCFGEPCQRPSASLDFLINFGKAFLTGLLFPCREKLTFQEAYGIVDSQDFAAGLGVHEIQAALVEGVMLLVLPTPIDQILLDEIEVRQVVVNERLHQREGML